MDKEKKKQWKISIIVGVSIIIIPIIIVGIGGLKQNLDKKRQIAAEEARLAAQVEVPNIIGMKVDEAKKALNDIGLQINIYDYDKKLTDEKPDEYVVDKQYPSAKEKVDPNTEVKVFFKELMVVKGSNYFEMRFKKTIPEFCESYNNSLESAYKQLEEDTTAIGLDTIKESDFSFYMIAEDTNCKEYFANKIGYTIALFTEPDSDYIVYGYIGFDKNRVANAEKMEEFIIKKSYASLVMSLTGCSYNSYISTLKEYGNKGQAEGSSKKVIPFYKNDIVYNIVNGGTNEVFYWIFAMGEDKYNKLVGKTWTVVPQSNEFYVNDTANVLNSDTEKYIIDINKKLYEKTGAQIVVVTVNNLEKKSIEEYSTELFRQYGIGSKDKNNGVLLILSVEDRKTRIEVGYGLEGRLTDEKTGMILDDHAVPYFKDNNWNDGIRNTFNTILKEVCKEYNITINEDIEN